MAREPNFEELGRMMFMHIAKRLRYVLMTQAEDPVLAELPPDLLVQFKECLGDVAAKSGDLYKSMVADMQPEMTEAEAQEHVLGLFTLHETEPQWPFNVLAGQAPLSPLELVRDGLAVVIARDGPGLEEWSSRATTYLSIVYQRRAPGHGGPYEHG